jgi:hypothetical protein
MSDGVKRPQRVVEVIGLRVRWLFVSRQTGRITVAQWPNLSLGAFIVSTLLLRLLRPAGSAADVLRIGASAALVVWSLDEMFRGVNPFRRVLGLGILVATVVNLTQWAH